MGLLIPLFKTPQLETDGFLSALNYIPNNKWEKLYTPTFPTYEGCLAWRNKFISDNEAHELRFNTRNCVVLSTETYKENAQ